MAAGLAHEIGTPLGVVRGRAELAQRTLDRPEKTREHLIEIESQIDRISGLIRHLLDLSRGSEGAKSGPVSPAKVLDKVGSFLAYEFQQEEITFEVAVDKDLVVLAESNSLFQIFLNLIVNAKHSFKDRAKGSQKNIRVSSERDGSLIKVIVEDNGCGIPLANLPRLFIPFFTSKAPGEGTGLGLVVARKLIRSWGGELSLTSQEGEGTKAILLFPADVKS